MTDHTDHTDEIESLDSVEARLRAEDQAARSTTPGDNNPPANREAVIGGEARESVRGGEARESVRGGEARESVRGAAPVDSAHDTSNAPTDNPHNP